MGKRLLFLNLLLLQLFLSLFLAYSILNDVFLHHKMPIIIVFLIITTVIVSNFWVVREMLRLADKEREAETTRVRLEEAKNLIATLRAKHHDFVNHLQVILGLIQVKREQDAADYIKRLSKDLIDIEKLVGLGKPEIAALISRKLADASHIRTSLVINTTLNELSVPPEKLVSIFGNLLDNALYEATLQEDKWLNIRIDSDDRWFIFELKNPGIIAPEFKERIYEPGFTTKGEKGTGMGLFIVKNLVEEYGGTVSCRCQEEEKTITFTVKLPKVSHV
ncbi:sensor histidine kinase [Calderihabitans maritimus]|uniref:histidine kinase n=1 Tax=Calderihabitans maritimus TaxID=1246530 RepID=A0A1Z5HQ76_9FIRM|nr:ATP-binding protein [Calderihabitans maritimus]GAW91430.1 signal transduction histidine kinase regulating citrate/malate metabolism [Calderihabitans maritimus]